MTALIIDPIGGIAGDMFLGLLLDLGADPDVVRTALASLDLPDWDLRVIGDVRRHVGCTRAVFEIPPEKGHRHLPEILRRIEASSLSVRARTTAGRAFQELAEAEARVHRTDVNHVHFHEVGAADAILDICGVAVALDVLGLLGDETASAGGLFVTPLPAGTGTVLCDHGELPVPVPAVVELCRDRFSLVAGRGEGEMVTPTGAALLRATALELPSGLAYRPERVGYGGGTRAGSLVRGTVVALETAGDTVDAASGVALEHDEIELLTVNVDDATGESLAHAAAQLMAAGALDVSMTPTLMKKGRPATIVQVMSPLARSRALALALMGLTGSIGVRHRRCGRSMLPRRAGRVRTEYGEVRVKLVPRLDLEGNCGPGERAVPEFDDCARLAEAAGIPIQTVFEAALVAAASEVIDG